MTQIAQAPAEVKKRITFEEFLAWDGENQHVEWVDGAVVVMSPVSDEHSEVTVFLITLLSQYAEMRQIGKVRAEPFVMRPAAGLPGRSPDVMFVANENLARLKPAFLDGPADLAVEVVSPDSRERDRGAKFYEYEQGGVREYWLIDPMRKQVEFHQRGDDGYYHGVPPGPDGRYHSQVLEGLWIEVAWLWQDPKPTILDVARLWGLS